MKTLTAIEAAKLVDELYDAPIETKKDVTEAERMLIASLVQRGYLVEIEMPHDNKDLVWITWRTTPLGRRALDCYRASQPITVT